MIGKIRMRFNRMIRYGNGDLVLTFRVKKADAFEAKQCVARLKVLALRGKKELEAKLDEYRESRSMNANAYFWKLCTELAARLCVEKTEVYRHLIYSLGIFTEVWVRESAAEGFIRCWESNGIGWIAEKMDTSDEDATLIHAYYGSSAYNRSEMARLIDAIVAECRLSGIETRTPEELARMKAMWGAA